MDDMPDEIEYGKDIQSSERFKIAWANQLQRCLISMIKDPNEFELSLTGLDSLLAYYVDEQYLKELERFTLEYYEEVQKIRERNRFNKANTSFEEAQARFDYNLKRFKAIIRLSGRATFLPIPNISLKVGGKWHKDEIGEEDVVVNDDLLIEADKKVSETIKKIDEEEDEEAREARERKELEERLKQVDVFEKKVDDGVEIIKKKSAGKKKSEKSEENSVLTGVEEAKSTEKQGVDSE